MSDGYFDALSAQTGRPAAELAAQTARTAQAADPARDQRGVGERSCGFCRRPLPEQTGKARRYEYCPSGTGPYEHIPDAGTCKELAAAQRRLRAARGTDSVPGATEVALAEDLSALRDLVDRLDSGAAAVRATLTSVGDKLDGDVATMRAERDAFREQATEATATAANETRLREIADRQVAEAVAAQAAAAKAAAADRETAAQAVQDKLAAEQEQARLEGENTQLRGRAERAEAQAETDRARVEAADRANAELTATVQQLTAHLDEARERAEIERGRADRADAATEALREQTARTIAGIRADAERKVEQAQLAVATARTEAAAQLTDATSRYAEDLAQNLRKHARELADLRRVSDRRHRQRLHAIRREVLHLVDTRLRDLAPDSEQLRDDLVALLDGWLTDDPDDPDHTNDRPSRT